jgi:PKD domain
MPVGVEQSIFLFTPGGADDPMSLALPNQPDIHSLWVPNPTTYASFQVPSVSGWTTFYQILALSAEAIPLDSPGYGQIQVVGNGSGAAFYIFVSTAFVSPWKAGSGVMPISSDVVLLGANDLDGSIEVEGGSMALETCTIDVTSGKVLLVSAGGVLSFNTVTATFEQDFTVGAGGEVIGATIDLALAGPLTVNEATINLLSGASITNSSGGGVIANFSYVASGISVQFTDGSYTDGSQGSIVAWLWHFGDTDTSTDQSPAHIYVSSGTYTVTLEVTTAGGATSEISYSLVVT